MRPFDFSTYKSGQSPFRHWIVDDFLDPSLARELSLAFPTYHSATLHHYDNPLEIKKLGNDWNSFPDAIYSFLSGIFNGNFGSHLERLTGFDKLFFDPGLHGSGMFLHGKGGHLNPHVDYKLHPKLLAERKLSCLLYLSEDFVPAYSGALRMYGGNESSPDLTEYVEIQPIFNRLVIFDCTLSSWHGVQPVSEGAPDDFLRKALGFFALRDTDNLQLPRRAKYSPREDQKDDKGLMDFIEKRADPNCKNTFTY